MNGIRNRIFVSLVTLALLALSPAAWACSSCYGDPNSRMSVGLTWAISIMVGIIAVVLAGVVTFFVRTVRHGESVTEPEAKSVADGPSVGQTETKEF